VEESASSKTGFGTKLLDCAGLVVEVCVSKTEVVVRVRRLDFVVINDEDVEEFVKMVLPNEASW
jgi:hypothetical protein